MQGLSPHFYARSLLLLVAAASIIFLASNSLPSYRLENLGETLVSEKQYFAALAAADSVTFLREFEYLLVLLLDAPEKAAYFKLRALEERKAFLRAYWKSHNPDPLLSENDWLLDFIRRCSYVKQNFPSPLPPYFDDRGKYYLRYGKPWYRYERHYYSNLLPNESWSYRKVAADFLVHFVELADGTYREVPSLMDAIIGASSSTKAQIWAELVHKRAAVSPALARASTKVNDLQLREKIGYEQEQFAIRDFSGKNLMISDIEFLAEPTNADQRQLLPTIKKLDVELAPYPHLEMRKSIPVFCYFELYNLKTAGVTDAYEITYRVITAKSRKGIIKKFSQWLTGMKDIAVSVTLTRPVDDDTAQELIAIDLSHVPNGACRLEITITAANNRNLVTSVQKEITITD